MPTLKGLALSLPLILSSALVKAENNDEWTYIAGGYLTANALDADTTIGTPMGDSSVAIDVNFDDLLDNLDYGASGIFRAQKGKLSINVDMLFIGLSDDLSMPLPEGSIEIDMDVDIREHELFVGYKAFEKFADLEILAGLRYVDQDITIKPTIAGQGTTVNVGDNWVDPFIGLRYLGAIGDNSNFNWILRGDIGGFGVGSDFAWRVDAGVSYDISEKWRAALFYKILDIDYETGTSGELNYYTWDGSESGITAGIAYKF